MIGSIQTHLTNLMLPWYLTVLFTIESVLDAQLLVLTQDRFSGVGLSTLDRFSLMLNRVLEATHTVGGLI
jgi:hypothetical protein